MPYTLTLGILWYLGALVLGVVLGWLGRSGVAARQIVRAGDRARADSATEMNDLRERTDRAERAAAERDGLRSELEQAKSRLAELAAADAPPAAPDLDGATEALGRIIKIDDLTVVVGIGPAVQRLCEGVGIRTWWDLANTSIDDLRSMLGDAGPLALLLSGSAHQRRDLRPHGLRSEGSLMLEGQFVGKVSVRGAFLAC